MSLCLIAFIMVLPQKTSFPGYRRNKALKAFEYVLQSELLPVFCITYKKSTQRIIELHAARVGIVFINAQPLVRALTCLSLTE